MYIFIFFRTLLTIPRVHRGLHSLSLQKIIIKKNLSGSFLYLGWYGNSRKSSQPPSINYGWRIWLRFTNRSFYINPPKFSILFSLAIKESILTLIFDIVGSLLLRKKKSWVRNYFKIRWKCGGDHFLVIGATKPRENGSV